MPYIDLKTSVPVSDEKARRLKEGFGAAIRDLGKTESWLMVGIEGEKQLFFKGEDGDFAIAQIALFGRASEAQYDNMTADVCALISDVLEIGCDRIYVKYEEVDHWGFNGFNF